MLNLVFRLLLHRLVVIPSVLGLPAEQQPAVSKRLSELGRRVMIPVAALVILMGLLRGIVFGPVQSFSFLIGTAYGIPGRRSYLLLRITLHCA